MMVNLTERAYQKWLDEKVTEGCTRREYFPESCSMESRTAFAGGHCSTFSEIQEKQAVIDALMLEYCPQEMTEQQVKAWAAHQRPVTDSRLKD